MPGRTVKLWSFVHPDTDLEADNLTQSKTKVSVGFLSV